MAENPGIAVRDPIKPMELKLAEQYCAGVKTTALRKGLRPGCGHHGRTRLRQTYVIYGRLSN